jgi:hypothetical protein
MNRRNFLKLTSLEVVVAATPLHFGLILGLRDQIDICPCGSGLEAHINHRCTECATAKEMNYFLFMKGLRQTP